MARDEGETALAQVALDKAEALFAHSLRGASSPRSGCDLDGSESSLDSIEYGSSDEDELYPPTLRDGAHSRLDQHKPGSSYVEMNPDGCGGEFIHTERHQDPVLLHHANTW